MNSQAISSRNPRSRWQLQLSSLLLIVVIFAVLLAWLADHRSLQSQIKPPEKKVSVVYQLQNASAHRVARKLSTLYPDQRFVVLHPYKSHPRKSVIAACNESVQEQIAIIIRHFDRSNTDMIELETAAENETPANRK